MSVYNGASTLRSSIESVLSQQGVDFEFIIVDDGSNDGSATILDEFAHADHRVRIVQQENRGLTRALIRGCALAKGKYIARQDCGDTSLPGRLRDEVRVIESEAQAALISCGTRFVGPQGELLYDVAFNEGDSTTGLLTLDPQRLRGPAHHGATLFRCDLYERVGGYREQFYFAQDLDLWIRLAEKGRHIALSHVLYQASFALGSIGGLHRRLQVACAKLILEAARLRREGLSEAAVLERAAAIAPERGRTASSDRAAALYFIGACLRDRDDPRARQYFRDALRANPLHVKSALRLLTG
jgi:Glycosyl transferase family 2